MSTRSDAFSSVRRPDPAEVRQCHAAGMSRNKTAEVLGVSTRQVDNVARELGLSWSSHATAEAVAARRQQAELERLDLADRWRELALDSVERALVEEDPGDRRRHAMAGEAATRSDLAIWGRGLTEVTEKDTAAENFVELLVGLRRGFTLLEETPLEEIDPVGEFAEFGTVPQEWEAEVDRSVSGVEEVSEEGDRPP